VQADPLYLVLQSTHLQQ